MSDPQFEHLGLRIAFGVLRPKPRVSRMVADRVTIANTVITAIQVHGPEVVPIVEKTLFPSGPPNNLTVADVLVAMGAHLDRTTAHLVGTDRTHSVELSDDDGARQVRELRTVDLKDFLSTLRSNLIRNYGIHVAGAYGLSAALPDDASSLLLLAGRAEDLFRTRPLVEPPKNKSLKIDPLLAADDMKDAAAALRSALSDIEREKREAQLTQGAKNESMATWGTVYAAAADGAAAFFALGGRVDLAQRVRPTARRRAGLPDEEAPPADAQTPPEPAANPTGGNT